MKKQDAIAMLTHEHREVKTKFAEFAGLSERSTATKKRIADQICEALTWHAQIEEEIFYPAVRESISDHDLMDEALVEHAAAKELIAQISYMDPGDDLYDARLKVLSEQIDHHVNEEESQMFPKVKKSKLDLTTLGEKMAARKQELEQGGIRSASIA